MLLGISEQIDLESYFISISRQLPDCSELLQAYITNVMKQSVTSHYDLSNRSLTLFFAEAKFNYKFEMFQQLGDWILFAKSFFPGSLNNSTEEYYDSLAQESYYRCYKILNKKWILFEEMADEFPRVSKNLQDIISRQI
jgi:hypothetical protein